MDIQVPKLVTDMIKYHIERLKIEEANLLLLYDLCRRSRKKVYYGNKKYKAININMQTVINIID